MHPIFNTIHCTSGIHCQSCRAREAGKAWRESFTRVHTKGEVPVDFDCPHGKPWIEDKPAPDGVWINPHTKVVRYQPGKPVTPTVSAKTQRFITDAQRQLAQQRKAICGACEHQKSMTDLTVSCGKCGCGGVPLYGEAKRCPEGKWQERREVVKPNLGDIAYQPARTKLPFFIHAQTPVYLQDLYRGRSAFLICGGPSFAALDHSLLRQPGILTMGVNNSVKTFRPNLWTHVDAADHFIRSIFLDPQIMKFSPMNLAGGRVWDSDKWDWTPYRVADCPNVFFYNRNAKFNAPTYLTESTINWGNSKERGGARSVMLVAVRILYELGIRRLFLLGADFNMSPEQKYHFDQDRKPGSISGNNYTYKVLQDRFATLRPIFERAGFYVYNCNPASKLTAFDHVPYEDAVRMVRDEFGNVDTANERTKDLYDTKKEPARVEQSAASESPASKPDLTIITPTGDRPEAFALCERWMSRQTFTGRVQWIVVDDGGVPTKVTLQKDGWTVEYVRRERKPGDPPHTLPVQLEEALRHAQSDRVAIVEDDDWYAPGYVETVHRRLNDHDLVGESHAIYYLVNPPHYKLLSNRHHASLAATAVKGEALAFLRSFLASFRSPNVDLHLWRHFKGAKQVHARSNAAPLIVQMKGVAGRRGTLRHHGIVPGYKPDADQSRLREWIGDDATEYRQPIPHAFDRLKSVIDGRKVLIVGKGPTFSLLPTINTSEYVVIGMNESALACKASVAVFNDYIDRIESMFNDKMIVAMSWQPHGSKNVATKATLNDIVNASVGLRKAAIEGRLCSFDLWSGNQHYKHGPMLTRNTSGESAIEIAAACGATEIHTIGIDGGRQHAEAFSNSVPIPHGYDRQWSVIAAIGKKYGVKIKSLLGNGEYIDRT